MKNLKANILNVLFFLVSLNLMAQYTGGNSRGDAVLASGNVSLPIELVSFHAHCSDGGKVELNWKTASEHNTNYFRIDRSRNGLQWDVLATIGAAGKSTQLIEYALMDPYPNAGIGYYRLVQYDLDGVYETFDPQAVVCNDQQAGTILNSYPNPTSGEFTVDLFTDELEGQGALVLTDSKGAVVHARDISIVRGTNNYFLSPGDVQSGLYYVTVKAGRRSVTTRQSIR